MESDRLYPGNPMHAKRFPQFVLFVIITLVAACDNVAFGGVQFELRPPEEAPGGPDPQALGEVAVVEPEPIFPIEMDPLLYLVERGDASRARILPIAQLSDDGYSPLPTPEDTPDLIQRFALDRWEQGTEFSLLAQGGRVGTLVSNGTTVADNSTCQVRPRGSGYVEVRPEAAGLERFLAIRPSEPAPREPWLPIPTVTQDAALRAASLNLAQRVIPVLGVLWPPSIPEVRRDLQPFSLGQADGSALAVSFVYGDRLVVGGSTARAYSLFMLAGESEGRFEPIVTWHQRAAARKAFPRFLGAHDLRRVGTPDAVLEVYGESHRWLTILGAEDEDWSILYLDACGEPASRGAIRNFP